MQSRKYTLHRAAKALYNTGSPNEELCEVASNGQNVKHLFIINPRSFWHKWKQEIVAEKIRNSFKMAENNNYEIHVSRFPRDAVGFIPLYAKNLCENTTLRVYAVGGDGILFDCLNGVMGLENAELAVVPYGRTNTFIKRFGKNGKTRFRNISRLSNAQAVRVDVLRCGNNYTLNYCVAGLEAETIRRARKVRELMDKSGFFSGWLSRRLYKFFYYMGALAACWNREYLRRRYEVLVDGVPAEGFYWGYSVLNSAFYCNKSDTGILDIFFIRGKGLLYVFLSPFYLTGRYKKPSKSFCLKHGGKISFRSDKPVPVCMADEVFYELDFSVELIPSAVKFVDGGMLVHTGGRR